MSVCRTNDVGRRKMKKNGMSKRMGGQQKHVVRRERFNTNNGATHQVLVTETSELLKLL